MEQVLMNLVVNARDAMPEGGTITIATRNSGSPEAGGFGTVTLAVTDTGMGMSPEVQARIFEPFFTTKEVGRGTGLGLSTSFGIIARCNGKVQVDSAPGCGTTFNIQLPACARANSESEELSSQAEAAVAAGCGTILLAEDDATVRGFVLAVLQDRGYQVLAAENGAMALEICSSFKGRIDALVTDVVMPEMNGRTLAEKARLVRPNLRVLFVSGYVDRGLKDEDILRGGNAFLEKPFSGEALLKIVADFCSQSPAERGQETGMKPQ
jgi:CheY-like chemotaxis protein